MYSSSVARHITSAIKDGFAGKYKPFVSFRPCLITEGEFPQQNGNFTTLYPAVFRNNQPEIQRTENCRLQTPNINRL